MSTKPILVPTDFTEVAHTAINHAVELAKTINTSVVILHVVKGESEIHSANEKLEEELKLAKSIEGDVEVSKLVKVGNIFDDIGDAANEVNASLIVMGTHGASGWQRITGSNALKVITNSTVPFVVVQKQVMKESGYDCIIAPLDLHNETKQKLEVVADMAQYFDSEVHIVTPKETDEFLIHKLNGNIAWAKKYLKERGVRNTTHISKKKGDFVEQMLEVANEVDADLISIMNLQKNSLIGMLSNYEQEIITNKSQIPVLCVNPVYIGNSGSVFTR
ncbi:MAG: universal stress protein [Flavobacteriales bacterium]|jgi:nucleotide-binding universal stress UspA family protein|nr:universal stress protein [Flavobacteriales bacterium]